MHRRYEDDWVDGRSVPPLVVDTDHVLTGIHQGTVHVEAGHFTLAGVLQGTLYIHTGVVASIDGTQQGEVTVEGGSRVEVAGAIEGGTRVQPGAAVIVESGARLAGSLSNDGLVVVRGVFGGARSGAGEFRLEGSGRVKQPTVRDGVSYYEW